MGLTRGPRARGLDLHEGYEAVDFRFVGGKFGEDAAEAEGVFAETGTDEVVAGGGGVALVEDEVDDFEDRGEGPGSQLGASGDFEGDVFFGECVRLARTMRWAIVASGGEERRGAISGGG